MTNVLKIFGLEMVKSLLLVVVWLLKLAFYPIQSFHRWFATVDKSIILLGGGFIALIDFAIAILIFFVAVIAYLSLLIVWPLVFGIGILYFVGFYPQWVLGGWIALTAVRTWYHFYGNNFERRLFSWELKLNRFFEPLDRIEQWLWRLWNGQVDLSVNHSKDGRKKFDRSNISS
ncbi:hypothetical protein MOTE_10290 [Moorella thermoacetica]|uniref:Uncharacterized protein n=1 Tax=Neomoorella thermoacetica TaxID=1525 RepID=A0A1J5P7E5_NEOTH|nr:hypothetical protein MOTE_10290 [Moorella thermoacetica]